MIKSFRFLPFLSLAIGTVVTLLIARIAQAENDAQFKSRLTQEIETYHQRINARIDYTQDALFNLRTFFQASNSVESSEFEVFAKAMLDDFDGFLAFELIDIVEAQPDTSTLKYPQVFRFDTDGQKLPVEPSDIYYPTRYFASNDFIANTPVGFDNGSEAQRFDAIQKAILSKGIAATGSIPGYYTDPPRPVIVIYAALYDADGAPTHIISLSVKTGFIVASSIADKADKISVITEDITDQAEIINVIEASEPNWVRYDDAVLSRTVEVGQRVWRFEISPNRDVIEAERSPYPWDVLIMGFMTTLLTSYILQLQIRRREGVEKLVNLRTAELRASMTNLREANEDLERFAYIASHDLRSPLRAIDNLVNWISDDIKDEIDPENANRLAMVKSRVRRLERLLMDLLTYSKAGREDIETEPIDLYELILELENLIYIPETMTVHIDESLKSVIVNTMPLKQILQNLMNNAVKHHDKSDGWLRVSCVDTGAEYLEITVSDNGPGIDPKFHDKVFEMFQTLKRRDDLDGSGMGLSISAKFAARYNGHITINSAAGEGASFTVHWPKGTHA